MGLSHDTEGENTIAYSGRKEDSLDLERLRRLRAPTKITDSVLDIDEERILRRRLRPV